MRNHSLEKDTAAGIPTWLLSAGVAALVAASMPARAHHSFSMFDHKQCLEMTGTVKQFQFSYPHSWIWLVVPVAGGGTDLYAFEGTDPASLRVRGWTQASVRTGDRITLQYRPLKDGRKGGSFLQVTTADGRTLQSEQACRLTGSGGVSKS